MPRYNRERDRARDYRQESWRPGENRERQGNPNWREGDDQGFFNRVGHEVRSWFGDDEGENRRWRDEYGGQREGQWTGKSRDYDRNYGAEYGRRRNPISDWNQISENRWETGNRGYDRGPAEDWRRRDKYWNDTYRERDPGFWRRESLEREYRPTFGGENFGGLGGPIDWMQNRSMATRGNFAGRGPRNYRRSDERILEDVNEQLTRHPMIDATDIEVLVIDSEVTLRGRVDDRINKRMAEDVAESVPGVKNVKNEIRVQGHDRKDERAA